jgi:hypothetical protein
MRPLRDARQEPSWNGCVLTGYRSSQPSTSPMPIRFSTSTPTVSALLIDWDTHPAKGTVASTSELAAGSSHTQELITAVRSRNLRLPIFVLADRSSLEELPMDVLREVNGYVWKLEDTPSAFSEFFCENTLRSDLSVSVAELGSFPADGGYRIPCLPTDRSPVGARSHADLATAA